MTSSKRVQDRSSFKRVRDLEIAAEKHKVFSKVLHLFEILKGERKNIVTLRSLDWHRHQANLPKPKKFSDFLRKVPKLFEMYKDHKGVIRCGMTPKAEELVQEEAGGTHRENGGEAAEHVTRLLMMAGRSGCVSTRSRISAGFRVSDGFQEDLDTQLSRKFQSRSAF